MNDFMKRHWLASTVWLSSVSALIFSLPLLCILFSMLAGCTRSFDSDLHALEQALRDLEAGDTGSYNKLSTSVAERFSISPDTVERLEVRVEVGGLWEKVTAIFALSRVVQSMHSQGDVPRDRVSSLIENVLGRIESLAASGDFTFEQSSILKVCFAELECCLASARAGAEPGLGQSGSDRENRK